LDFSNQKTNTNITKKQQKRFKKIPYICYIKKNKLKRKLVLKKRKMKENQFKKWEQTRQLGPWKYGLLYGTIWALFVVAFVFIVNSFLHFDDRMITASGIFMMLVIYWITGIILYRFIFWRVKEKAYQSWKANQNRD
jgi:uncharacterized membrane protein YfcA